MAESDGLQPKSDGLQPTSTSDGCSEVKLQDLQLQPGLTGSDSQALTEAAH